MLQEKKGSKLVNQPGEDKEATYCCCPQATAKNAKESAPQTVPLKSKPIKGARVAKNINKNCCHNLIIV